MGAALAKTRGVTVNHPPVAPQGADNRALLAAIAGGDRLAFATLYRIMAPRLRSFLISRTRGDMSQSEELLQETMLTVWKRATTYDESKASPSTWMFTIARNRFIDRCRKALRPTPDLDDPCFIPAGPEAPDRSLERARRSRKLHSALSKLPDDQRVVLRQAYFEGKAQSAVASDLGVPLGTVKSRARLAIQRLRLEIEIEEAI